MFVWTMTLERAIVQRQCPARLPTGLCRCCFKRFSIFNGLVLMFFWHVTRSFEVVVALRCCKASLAEPGHPVVVGTCVTVVAFSQIELRHPRLSLATQLYVGSCVTVVAFSQIELRHPPLSLATNLCDHRGRRISPVPIAACESEGQGKYIQQSRRGTDHRPPVGVCTPWGLRSVACWGWPRRRARALSRPPRAKAEARDQTRVGKSDKSKSAR